MAAALAMVMVPARADDPVESVEQQVVAAHNAGGGTITGPISFSPSIPASGSGCASGIVYTIASTPGWGSETVVGNSVISAYAGAITLSGTATSSQCESWTQGGGNIAMTLNAPTTSQGSTLSCTTLNGGYNRVGPALIFVVSGACTVNQYGQGTVTLAGQVELVPTTPGQGVIAPVSSAEAVGAYAVATV